MREHFLAVSNTHPCRFHLFDSLCNVVSLQVYAAERIFDIVGFDALSYLLKRGDILAIIEV